MKINNKINKHSYNLNNPQMKIQINKLSNKLRFKMKIKHRKLLNHQNKN